MKLTEIETRTDKAEWNHNYLPTYETLFSEHKERSASGAPLLILEIGIYRGDSHQLWADYFPGATILGYDPFIHGEPLRPNIRYEQIDAYTQAAVDLTPRCDIIIDDGPHTLESMLFVAEHYTPKLVPGGILVIEDVKSLDWIPELQAATAAGTTNETYDLRSTANSATHDDIMYVVRRPQR